MFLEVKLRPAPNQFRIYWLHNSKLYEHDFVAETADCIYLIEAKGTGHPDMNSGEKNEIPE